MNQIRVLIADDHAVVRKGIQMIIGTEPAIQLVGEAKNSSEAVYQAQRLQPDVILLDLVMPDEDGLEALIEIKRSHPNIKIIVLTTFEEDHRIQAALEAGADGYLLKDADGEALLRAIEAVQQGEMPLHPRVARHVFGGRTDYLDTPQIDHLTEREKEVLQLLAKGLSNRDVAQRLSLSEGTVKIHVSNILGKLQVSSRTEAAMLAIQQGLVPISGEAKS